MARESAVEPDGLRVVDGDGEGVGLKNVCQPRACQH